MMIDSFRDFMDSLRQSRVLDPDPWETLNRDLQWRFREPTTLAKELIERGWLTPYQVNQLFHGRGGDLVLGSYVLQERLGKGGMGQVYKARHRKIDRVLALKLIRKELLANPTAVLFFHREIQAAAQLTHPNIVLAYDADTVDGVHFYTMEYVEGTTFSRLIQASGPLPVLLACESVRQAALGIQHAFERKVVHRDINPSNLMLSWTSLPTSPPPDRITEEQVKALWGSHMPLIKILDMGLARVYQPGEDMRSSALSPSNLLLGTPDFTAPEQTLNAQAADIRSDLYSLGCAFYYMLTAEVPFPHGKRLEKLLRHQLEEPRPIQQLQPQVPAEVVAVVRKLMSKRPEDRYQTPVEVAAVLGELLARK